MKKKASFEDIIKIEGHSILLRDDVIHYSAEVGFHMHPEYELAYLSKGGGIRCINDMTEAFNDEDIVLLPGNIPHCWIFDPSMCTDDGKVRDCSCQFRFEEIGRLADLFPEFSEMLGFYRNLKQAMKITGASHQKTVSFFNSSRTQTAAGQTLSFLSLLNSIYESGCYTFIGSPETIGVNGVLPRLKFNAIHKLITENYSRSINLSEAAGLLSMNKTAFCNAFRRMYGTTFIRYLTSYRMKVAARLLVSTTLNISDIAYRTGFNDIPHFNRTFAGYYHTTPSRYRHSIGNSDSVK